jgi:D-alanine-D-alanine ligase-like ATP-grasp enzyme
MLCAVQTSNSVVCMQRRRVLCMHAATTCAVQTNNAVVYNLVHGSLQQYLSYFAIPYTGSPETPSRICFDKLETAEFIGVRTLDRVHVSMCGAALSAQGTHIQSALVFGALAASACM